MARTHWGASFGRHRILGLAIAIALSGIGTAAAPPRVADAATPESSFYFESEPGDPVGSGRTGFTTSVDSAFGSYDNGGIQTAIGINGPLGWWVIYAFGPDGAHLTTGTYTNTAYLNAGPGQATLAPSWSGEGGCDFNPASTGTFTVHDVAYEGTLISRLSMSFHVDCAGAAGSLDGELRFKSAEPAYKAIRQEPANRTPGAFGSTAAGSTSPTTTLTYTNVGTGGLTIGAASLSGPAAAEFAIATDTCSTSTLATGAQCSIGVKFAPASPGAKTATLSFAVDTAAGIRAVALSGTALVPTTTTLEAPSGIVFQPVSVTAHVVPVPQPTAGYHPAMSFFVNGVLNVAAPIDGSGSATANLRHLPPGVYHVRAVFGGLGDLAPSQSPEATFEIGTPTTTSLSSSINPALSTQPISFTASVTNAPNGGTMTIVDTTTGTTLGSWPVTATASAFEATATLAPGDHRITATYSGHGSFGASSTELVQTVVLDQAVDAADLGIAWSSFYPVKDTYRDTLRVGGRRNEPIAVGIDVFSVATGARVGGTTIPEGTGAYAWQWTGRSASGSLRPAGKYRIVQRLTDLGGNVMTSTSYVVLSHKKLYWYSTSVTLNGSGYYISGDWGSGWVSKTRSSYARGVRLNSGDVAVAVGYVFSIKSSPAYRNVTFKVLGRSPNGRRAVIGLWNPGLGSYALIESYDAGKLVGPGYAWYSTRAQMASHRSGGKVRAIVLAVNTGSPVQFDIAKVQVAYQYSVLK